MEPQQPQQQKGSDDDDRAKRQYYVDRCLKLLHSNSDEEKFAALLVLTKLFPSASSSTASLPSSIVKEIYRGLIASTPKHKLGILQRLLSPHHNKSDHHQLALNILSVICDDQEFVSSEPSLPDTFVPLLLKLIQGFLTSTKATKDDPSSQPSSAPTPVVTDAFRCLSVIVSNQPERGIERLDECDSDFESIFEFVSHIIDASLSSPPSPSSPSSSSSSETTAVAAVPLELLQGSLDFVLFLFTRGDVHRLSGVEEGLTTDQTLRGDLRFLKSGLRLFRSSQQSEKFKMLEILSVMITTNANHRLYRDTIQSQPRLFLDATLGLKDIWSSRLGIYRLLFSSLLIFTPVLTDINYRLQGEAAGVHSIHRPALGHFTLLI